MMHKIYLHKTKGIWKALSSWQRETTASGGLGRGPACPFGTLIDIVHTKMIHNLCNLADIDENDA